jgi:hypothetical protein
MKTCFTKLLLSPSISIIVIMMKYRKIPICITFLILNAKLIQIVHLSEKK